MKSYPTIIFDFDSTLFPGETLDEIIQFALKNDPAAKEKNKQIKKSKVKKVKSVKKIRTLWIRKKKLN